MHWLYDLLVELWNRVTAYPAGAIPFFWLVGITAVLLYVAHRPEPKPIA